MAFSQPDETLSATNEDSLYNQAIDYLKSDIWQFRDAGVALLVQLNDLDTTQIIAILINSLKDEIDSPLSLEGAAGTYFTVSEYLKNKYCLELRKFGSVAKREILKRLVSAEGEFKSRFIILLGFLGDESYRDKIRQIYYDSNDGYLRLFALRGLMSFKDNEDVPLFKDALNDDFQAINNTDVVTRGKSLYIIRMDAAGALGMRGFKLKPDGDNYIIISEPDSGANRK
jgi:hypothetical protein